jgi:hypothetical protein
MLLAAKAQQQLLHSLHHLPLTSCLRVALLLLRSKALSDHFSMQVHCIQARQDVL